MGEPLQLCATDKEIFDILLSKRKNMSDAVLFALAQDRRVFCSHKMDREAIADYISGLPHDYNDLQTIIEQSELPGRGEKATFITFDGEIAATDIREALERYAGEGGIDKLTVPMQVSDGLTATLSYTEFDFSRTRLAQRQPKEATLIFTVADGKTTVRLPANERARGFVSGIASTLAALRTAPIETKELSIGRLTSELRTRFFTKLISAIPDHQLQTVINLKVASLEEGADSEDDSETEATAEILAVVKRASLSGENLIATPQFRSLIEAGFFISAVRWRSLQASEPRDLIQFDASLENAVAGTGLRYLVRSAPGNSADTAQFKKIDDIRERNLLRTLEDAAKAVLSDLEGHDAGKDAS